MSFGSNYWARLSFSPSTGELTVDGDLFAVLGINADELTRSSDPFSLLPDSVARGLIEGNEIIRDQKLSLVIIPGEVGYCNTVTLISEKPADFDLVSDMAGGVVGLSPDGIILRWNKRMTYLFGPMERDVMGRNASDILPAPVLYNWASVISSAHLGHEVRVEFIPSGEKRVEGILSRGGPGVIGLFRDSTESYSSDKRLRALNRLNQAYLQSTGTGLLLLDSRLRILVSNSGFSRISGHNESLIGLQLHDVLPEESYRWTHDASEHLCAEESAEQSGIISCINHDGKKVTLRQTLRAVRNEANQAVNFVCLFEDETDLTLFREEVDHLKKSLLSVSRMSLGILETASGTKDSFCEDLLRITRSRAVAQYAYDSHETMKLKGSAGAWPGEFPPEETGKYGFPAYVWGGDRLYRISSVELGILSGQFKSCIVLPTGEGISNRGYLILAESALGDSDSVILNAVSSLAKLQCDISEERRIRSFAEKLFENSEKFTDTLLNGIPLPVAIVRKDGRIEHWNRVMEQVCGVRASEVGEADLKKLIDPDDSGLTLDAMASGPWAGPGGISAEWPVKRLDGSESSVYRWHVSIIESPSGLYRDSAFLISGFPSGRGSSNMDEEETACGKKQMFLEDLKEMLSAPSPMETLRVLSRACFRLGGGGIMQFHSEGKLIASFPEGTVNGSHHHWNILTSVILMGREYDIRASGIMDPGIVNSLVDMLSSRNCRESEVSPITEAADLEIKAYSSCLTGYLERNSSYSIEQTSALLHVVDKTDPLAGFARTMLYSQETARRAAHILKLSMMISKTDFRVVCLDRFLSGLHSIFAERGQRPPALSFSDKLPDVLIVPEVVLRCLSILGELSMPDGVVFFTARNNEENSETGVHLILSGLDEPLADMPREDIIAGIESGKFDTGIEAGLIFKLLEAAGCTLITANARNATFFLRSVVL
jgi:PAS domain S-box-containing protein